MCGRFTTKMTWAEIVALYRLTITAPPHNMPPRYNVCPTMGEKWKNDGLLAVRIGPREPIEGGPNWQVLEFTPRLPRVSAERALKPIDVPGGYALTQ